MNSSVITADTYQSGATSAYPPFLPLSESSMPLGPTDKASSTWRKFIHAPMQQRLSATAVTVVPSVRTITEGPVVIKPAPTPNELLSGPLFQVAGMFAIGEPGWADKHDEYLAETYLESHADKR